AGKPMIQWVLDALSGAARIQNVIVIGLGPEAGLNCEKPLVYFPNQGGMLANIRAGIAKAREINPQTELVLLVSSDIPAVTSEMVDWMIDTALETQDDLYYGVIAREVMESRFPGSKRSFIKLKGSEVCGGDMHVLRASIAEGRDEIWEGLIGRRKNALKQASMFGFGTLLQVLLRRISLEEAVPRLGEKLELRGRAILCPYAELGMDVDKPYQLEILQQDLGKHRQVS
ncbi:MAG: nucleotidyltransferase family protein, partial [Anaerolineales bacterium]|nr:nucleotidyltransferase family protein [Anaerolineales bacterium]